ncbi:kinase-like domain-containing protein [Lineolata rhizophorae]|uniref:Kinase-like domain-containing protein n=1 Tax=Lineolata rhizophorae TaxID=578093 RepID=A0A6A6PD77_9PEZI|nr:kinase-like domain-containing protein [Lineolata rhizophorae]
MNTPSEMIGQSGRAYVVERVLQDEGLPFGRVLFARHARRNFSKILVLKGILRGNFRSRLNIYERVGSSPFLRGLLDTIPEQSMILKDALRGLTALHERNIVHNDVKANNILIDVKEEKEKEDEMEFERIQLADLEDAAHIPPGSILEGAQLGNWMWRSPEAHAQGPVGKASDIFSFGVVCIYAVTKRVIFAVDNEELAPGEELLAAVLERQISCFADEDGLHGLLRHLGEKNPWCQVFEVLESGFNKENPRKPFSLWRVEHFDEDFKDLISGLTNFDPAKRITGQEALAHRWFEGI